VLKRYNAVLKRAVRRQSRRRVKTFTNMAPFVGGAALAAATAHAAQVPGNREPGLAHEAGKATDKTY